MDWVGHNVDIAHWSMGYDETGPVKISGKGEFPKDGLWDAPTKYRLDLEYPDKLKMKIIHNGNYIKWIGDAGSIKVHRNGIEASKTEFLKEEASCFEKRLYRSDSHIGNFVDCVISRKKTICPVETGHRSASVGHLCMVALQTGQPIIWDPAKEKIVGNSAAESLLMRVPRGPWSL